jgi:hypothetical protein
MSWLSAGNVQLQLRAAVRPEKLKPSAKLEALLIPLRPMSAELAPLQVSSIGVGFQQHATAGRRITAATL